MTTTTQPPDSGVDLDKLMLDKNERSIFEREAMHWLDGTHPLITGAEFQLNDDGTYRSSATRRLFGFWQAAQARATQAAPSAQPVADERAAFEAWAIREDGGNWEADDELFSIGTDGEYVHVGIRNEWNVWQARATLPVGQPAPGDPMDWPLPCDVKTGAMTIRKGCKLRTLVTRMGSLHRMAMAANPADEAKAAEFWAKVDEIHATPAAQEVEPAGQRAVGEEFRKCTQCNAITHADNPEETCPGCADTAGQAAAGPTLRQVEELFSEYWDIAYAEGQGNCYQSEKANAVLSKLRALFAAPTVAAAGPVASIDTPEFQELAEVWRNEPYGYRSFYSAWDALIAHIDAKLAAAPDAARDAKDAERYRWLRSVRDIPHGSRAIPWVVQLDPKEKMHTIVPCLEGDLDRAVDAALSSHSAAGEGGAK